MLPLEYIFLAGAVPQACAALAILILALRSMSAGLDPERAPEKLADAKS